MAPLRPTCLAAAYDPLSNRWANSFARILAIVLVTHTPAPTVCLQIFYGFVWLLNGLAIARLARVLWPDSLPFPLVAGCLMITATSDFMTTSVVYSPHLFGIALFFLGIAQLLLCAKQDGTVKQAIGAALLLGISFFTVEYTYPMIPLLPILLWLHVRPFKTAHQWRAFIALGLAFIPAFVLLLTCTFQPGTYAARVAKPTLSLGPLLASTATQVMHNFLPLSWAWRAIPPWYDNYVDIIPYWYFILLGTLSSLIVLFFFWRQSRAISPIKASQARHLAFLLILVLLAIVALNGASAQLGGEYFVRSHFVSRGMSSLSIALVICVLAQRSLSRWVAAAILVFFVSTGVWGGIERQGYNLAYALAERRELASLLQAVPALAPSVQLLVIQPPGSPSVLGVTNPNTIPFLYGDHSLHERVIMAQNSFVAYSTIGSDDSGQIKIITNSTQETLVNPANCVAVFYSPSQAQFIRLDTIPAGLLRKSDTMADLYNPKVWLAGQTLRKPPQAMSDFLSHSALRWPFPARSQQGPPHLLTISGARPNTILTDSLTPYIIEYDNKVPFVWLGSGWAEGYTSLVWSKMFTQAEFRIAISPGLSHGTTGLHLHVRRIAADGSAQSWASYFDKPTTINLPISLSEGNNVLEMWISEKAAVVPSSSDPRHLMARLNPMLLVIPE